jgi:sporulation protein YlmC with PRC-barrel domain
MAALAGSACAWMIAGVVLGDGQHDRERPNPNQPNPNQNPEARDLPRQTPPGQATPGQPMPGARKEAFKSDSFAQHIRKASDIIGKDVTGTGGEDLGDVQDLAIDPDRGRVVFVVVDRKVGGGEGNFVAVPISAFQSFAGESLRLNASKATLERAATFSGSEWNRLEDLRFAGEIYTTYNERPYWETDTTGSRALRVVKASDLIGREVTNTQDQDLGDIEELAIDTHQGHIALAVVEFGGFLGMGTNKVAVPWKSFNFPVDDEGKLVLNINKEKLENAPTFDADDNLIDSAYVNNVYGFFGTTPYWKAEMGQRDRMPGMDPAQKKPGEPRHGDGD